MIKFLKDKSLSAETHVDKCTTTDLSTIRPDSAPFWALRAPEALATALRARCVGLRPSSPVIPQRKLEARFLKRT